MRKTLSLISLAAVALLCSNAQSTKKCRVLVMSGGANRGAYEAGVIHGLSHLLNGTDAYYDVVSGVSAGSLNSAAMSVWAPEQAKEMSEWLIGFWKNVTGDMIFKAWPGGLEEGFYNRTGIFDTSPLLNTLVTTMQQLGGKIQRRVVAASVDVETGEYVPFTEKNTKYEDFPKIFLASASVPFVFPMTEVNGRKLMDGGTVWNTNMESAVERCMEIVDKEEDIIMDVAICSDGKLGAITTTGDTIQNYLRSWDLMMYHRSVRDVREWRLARPNVGYRYFFMPSKPLDSTLQLLTFTPEVLVPMLETGMDDANTIVTTTQPGESFKQLDDWYDNVNGLKSKHPYLSDYLYAKQRGETA